LTLDFSLLFIFFLWPSNGLRFDEFDFLDIHQNIPIKK
jgi:hypothetical protein